MTNQHQADYKPTTGEILLAAANFLKAVEDSDLLFKIGRCAASGAGSLEHRDMCADAVGPPSSLWSGSPSKVAWIERRLIALAIKHYPQRCKNEQRGGGPVGEDPVHHVYIVFFPRTPEQLADLWLLRINEIPD